MTERYAHAWCRISRYLDSMKALGYNPHVAFQIALAGNAADMSSIMIEPRKGGEQLRDAVGNFGAFLAGFTRLPIAFDPEYLRKMRIISVSQRMQKLLTTYDIV